MKRNEHPALQISLAVAIMLLIAATTTACASKTYIVRKGDTLGKIAKNFSTTISELERLNNISNIHRIRTGQKLIISTDDQASSQKYVFGAKAKCMQDEVEVRAGNQVVAILTKGMEFTILARTGNFIRIKLENGRIGWVPINTLTAPKPAEPTVDRYSIKREIVRTAFAFRGARYRRGGTSRGGFDCSGFVKYVYATKGIKLPHSSKAMFNCGKPVAQSDLQEGDIVFFNHTYRHGISHVGIYIGNRQFIHASSQGRGVRIDSLDQSYYRRRYAGARRMVSEK
ncbi:MAG: NlpC/P60 family protein [Armatimonadota bacterium]|nr:NlpC/P60 family protein [Armatimonadota bacterium]